MLKFFYLSFKAQLEFKTFSKKIMCYSVWTSFPKGEKFQLRESWGEQCAEVKQPMLCVFKIEDQTVQTFEEEWLDKLTPQSVGRKLIRLLTFWIKYLLFCLDLVRLDARRFVGCFCWVGQRTDSTRSHILQQSQVCWIFNLFKFIYISINYPPPTLGLSFICLNFPPVVLRPSDSKMMKTLNAFPSTEICPSLRTA